MQIRLLTRNSLPRRAAPISCPIHSYLAKSRQEGLGTYMSRASPVPLPCPRDRAVSMACDGPSCVTPDASTTSLNTLHGGALKEPYEHTMAPSLSAQKLPRAVQSLPCTFSGLVWHLGGLQRQDSRNNLGGRSGSLPGWLFVQRRAEVQGCPPS